MPSYFGILSSKELNTQFEFLQFLHILGCNVSFKTCCGINQIDHFNEISKLKYAVEYTSDINLKSNIT